MFLAKKYLLSFLIIASLSIWQFNTIFGIKIASADSSLLSTQSLLTTAGDASYGNSHKDVQLIVLQLINTVLGFLAILTVVLLFIAGFGYMTSGGSEEKIKKSIGQIKALVIGLLIILVSWGITYYLLRALACVTSTTGTTCNGLW